MYPDATITARPMEDLIAARDQFLAGDSAPAGVRPVVLASWERCRAHGINPFHLRPQLPDPVLLVQARKRSAALLEAAEPFLQLAHDSLPEHPHLIALSDRDGLILRIRTGQGLPEEDLEPSNLFESASWTERDIGCNGVGTCLATGEPVILIGPEHFQHSYIGWTCIGVPIRSRGQIVGALDFSVPNEHARVHAWGWTLALARGIEANLVHGAPAARAGVRRMVPDMEEPFQAVRGVFDLLARQLDLSPTHARFLEEARAKVTEAEAVHRTSVARLQDSEERLRRIAESGMVGLLFWELDGRITYANDRFLEMVGYSREELEADGIDWRGMTPPEWDPVDAAAIEELRTVGATTPFEKEFSRKDGSRFPVLLSAATFSGTTERGVTLVLDIAERKRAEREIRRSYEEAQKALEERDRVLAVVSHDLRNPLNTITMASGLLIDEIPADRKRAQPGIIRRAAEQMTRLIEDLLDVSRIEAGALRVTPEPCACGELIRGAVEFLSPLAESRSVALRAEPGSNAVVEVDRQRLLQVFTNLISNAIDHTPPGGVVAVGAEESGRVQVRIYVRDTGAGIHPEHLPYVFDRFWQARRTGRAGAGLGLAIAKGIVKSHAGRLWVESERGEGTTFYFTLPFAPLDGSVGSPR